MDRKRTRGRQKIQIQKITNESDCFATFSKRRVGLLKKASEICTLCNVDIGIMMSSPTGKPYSFFHPTMESVFHRYYHPNQQPNNRLYEAFTRTKVTQLNKQLDELSDNLDAEKEREKQIIKKKMTGGLWSKPMEELNSEQVQQMLTLLKDLQIQMTNYKNNNLAQQASTSAVLIDPGVQNLPTMLEGQSTGAYNAEFGERNGQKNYQNLPIMYEGQSSGAYNAEFGEGNAQNNYQNLPIMHQGQSSSAYNAEFGDGNAQNNYQNLLFKHQGQSSSAYNAEFGKDNTQNNYQNLPIMHQGQSSSAYNAEFGGGNAQYNYQNLPIMHQGQSSGAYNGKFGEDNAQNNYQSLPIMHQGQSSGAYNGKFGEGSSQNNYQK